MTTKTWKSSEVEPVQDKLDYAVKLRTPSREGKSQENSQVYCRKKHSKNSISSLKQHVRPFHNPIPRAMDCAGGLAMPAHEGATLPSQSARVLRPGVFTDSVAPQRQSGLTFQQKSKSHQRVK